MVSSETARVFTASLSELAGPGAMPRPGQLEAVAALVEGRRELTGTVLGVKSSEGYYGQIVYRMTVDLGDGTRVNGTAPAALLDLGVGRGDMVTFTALVERSRGDHTFGFYKRPSKASAVLAARPDGGGEG